MFRGPFMSRRGGFDERRLDRVGQRLEDRQARPRVLQLQLHIEATRVGRVGADDQADVTVQLFTKFQQRDRLEPSPGART